MASILNFCVLILFVPFYDCDSQISRHVGRKLSATCLQFEAVSTFTLRTNIPAKSEVCVDVANIPANVRYFILEAHSQKLNITLSYLNSSEAIGNSVTGTGVGLVSLIEGPRFETFWVFNTNSEDLNVLLSLVSYEENDPVAGGCNMEFPVEISPFLRIHFNRANTRLEFQHANLGYEQGSPPPLCSSSINMISYMIYLYFLPEMDFSEEKYFSSMELMRNVSSIRAHGKEVQPYAITPRTRAIFMSYPGQGVIYNVIAQSVVNGELYEAAYTPLATYSCNFETSLDGCRRLTGPFGKVLALVLAVFGLAMVLRGHRYLTIEMAYFGFLAGALITFVMIARFTNILETDRDVLTVTGGVVFAIIWAGVWWFFGIPVLSVLLVGVVLGFLCTSVIYFTPVGGADILRNDFNYWMILACGMLAVPVLLLPATRMLSIIGSSIVGSYFIIVAVDRFTGTTLSYIVLNVVKRAVFEDTSLASNAYPFQTTDIILSSVWVFLSLVGIILQRYLERNRAPFPPVPFKTWRREWQQRRERRMARLASLGVQDGSEVSAERTPLLRSSSDTYYDRAPPYESPR